jgi:hypothetical protein
VTTPPRDAAHADVPAADGARRDAIPTLPDAMLAGPCGVSGAKCPTYVGSTIWVFRSPRWVSGSMGPDGALYIGGSLDNSFDFDPTLAVDVEGTEGQSSAFLMKLNPAGVYQSTFTVGGNTFGAPQMGAPAVTATASFVPGSFEGTIDLDPGPGVATAESMFTRGGSFISKFDAAGKYVWGRFIDSSESGLVNWGGPVATPDGGVILTGTYAGPSDLAPGPALFAPPNNMGAFVTRLDATGKQLWVRTLGGEQCGTGMGAALDAGGVLWLSGTVSDSCAFDQGSGVVPEGFFIASMTLDGTIRTIGSVMGGGSLAAPPVVARDGSIYLAGTLAPSGADRQSTIDVDPSAGVSNRTVSIPGLGFVMKLDNDGKLRWFQPTDLSLSIFGAVALTPDDGLMLAGDWNSGATGISILRMDAGGNTVWRLRAGGRDTVPSSLLVNSTGFFLLGQQNGPGDLDPSPGVDYQKGPLVFLSKYVF